MSLKSINPGLFDKIVSIATNSGNSKTGDSWANTYTSVKAKKTAPLRSGTGAESIEVHQEVYTERLTWLIRAENRAVIANKMAVVHDSKYHMITNVRRFQGSRVLLALDTEYRDNT